MKQPNLFKIATSELSQDAFITWLLQWGDEKFNDLNKSLHNCSVCFIQSLLNTNEDIKSVEAGRQWNHIDVWAKINDKHFLIIEDKKGTKEHSNQLNRYKSFVEGQFPQNKYRIVPVYYKMDEQSNFLAVQEAGYSVFSRTKMLSILDGDRESHEILFEYYSYLNDLNNSIEAYRTLPVDKWDWFAWRGFFSKLQKELETGDWDYVSNRAGGFLGFWWHWKEGKLPNTKFNFYLQLEYDKMIVKVESFDKEARNEIRSSLRPLLYQSAQEQGIELKNYGRVGNYMGIVRILDDYRVADSKNVIDMEQTVNNLKKAELLINSVYEKMEKNS